uniref:Uncharacterized protein n=1 Tax=viral metagenome TaxID=1070528 RepID=A0A6C0B290_9ZZZZ
MNNVDEISKKILTSSGIFFTEQNEILIPRDSLLSDTIYNKIKPELIELKKILSSSALTSLQTKADKQQKWPLLNLVRQILNVYGYKMIPVRKCDGYTLDGVKKFKRYFNIIKKIDAENHILIETSSINNVNAN